jgi:hypothetical protein
MEIGAGSLVPRTALSSPKETLRFPLLAPHLRVSIVLWTSERQNVPILFPPSSGTMKLAALEALMKPLLHQAFTAER